MFKFLVSKLESISRQSKTSTSEWRRALAYLPFFLVGIGFIGIIGILWSSFVTLVPHTRSRCKYANRRNSHQIVKRSLVQLPPFPWIQQLLLSNIHRDSIAVYHLVMERVRLSGRRALKDWFGFYFEGESTSWLYHQLLDLPHLILAEWGRLIDASSESPVIYNRGQTNTNTPKILCWIKTYKS